MPRTGVVGRVARNVGHCIALALIVGIVAACGSQSAGTAAKQQTIVGTQKAKGGLVLVDVRGHTLYAFSRGTECSGKCASVWQPLLASGKVAARSGSQLDESLLGTTKRQDGKQQVTYDDQPLYAFAQESAGQLTGDGAKGFGGSWEAVRPSSSQLQQETTGGTNSCEPNCGY